MAKLVAVIFAIVVLAAPLAPATADSYQRAIDALGAGDQSAFLREIQAAGKQGQADAALLLGIYLGGKHGDVLQSEPAFQWFLKAARGHNPWGQMMIGLMYFEGSPIARDRAQAAVWLRRAADQGHSWAQAMLGYQFATGRGVAQNLAEAYKWIAIAIEGGWPIPRLLPPEIEAFVPAQYMDDFLSFGRKFEVPAEQMLEKLRAAMSAEQLAQALAQVVAWRPVTADDGGPAPAEDAKAATPSDRLAALEKVVAKAKGGDADAQFDVGLMLETGSGVVKDEPQAALWYRRAVEQGHLEAMYRLGILYQDGRGVEQNYAVAAEHYTAAATAGHAKSHVALARLYEDGDGVARDYTAAVSHYRAGAALGEGFGQANLGRLYSVGKGVPQNFIYAYAWFGLALEILPDGAARDRSIELRDAAEARLNPAELSRAKSLVAKLRSGEAGEAKAQPLAPPGATVVTAKLVREVQGALAKLGYDAGPLDGMAGPRTRSAVAEFQDDYDFAINGRVSRELYAALLLIQIAGSMDVSKPAADTEDGLRRVGAGSGFVVSRDGHVLTNDHVINGCIRIKTGWPNRMVVAALIGSDRSNDLALLKSPTVPDAVARFHLGRGARVGADVVATGFPLQRHLAPTGNVTVGTISALAGPGGDSRLLQLTAPIQKGNSGGPLLNGEGNVVGVIVSKLDALRIAKRTGDVPQNVNFAINGAVARIFLEAYQVAYEIGSDDEVSATPDVAAESLGYTVLVECWK